MALSVFTVDQFSTTQSEVQQHNHESLIFPYLFQLGNIPNVQLPITFFKNHMAICICFQLGFSHYFHYSVVQTGVTYNQYMLYLKYGLECCMDNIARGVRSRDQYSTSALLCLETSPRVQYCPYNTNKPCFKCFIVICVGGVQLKKGIANQITKKGHQV